MFRETSAGVLGVVVADKARSVVADDAVGKTAKITEGRLHVIDPSSLSLSEIGFCKDSAGVAQLGYEKMKSDRLTVNEYVLFSEINLHVLSRGGLITNGDISLYPFQSVFLANIEKYHLFAR